MRKDILLVTIVRLCPWVRWETVGRVQSCQRLLGSFRFNFLSRESLTASQKQAKEKLKERVEEEVKTEGKGSW